ncbi:MAG: PQQ-dependent sugar dehydrogenase [Saprospiraceae bacterium]|nr:PQQ-dependent sugar dehydrogenase [Saprospiraceae bacterium]
MFRFLLFLAPLFLLIYCNRDLNQAAERKATHVYKTDCASCHGATVENFVERDWKYGSSRLEIIRSIGGNFPGGEKHNFARKMKEQEVQQLGQYIIEAIVARKQKMITEGAPTNGTYTSQGMTVQLDTIARNLDNPWGMVFLPNGDLLFTERTGKLWRLTPKGVKTEIGGVPATLVESQGGLLDVELHPQFATNGFVYLSYSKFRDSADVRLSTTAVRRARLEGDQLLEGVDIFTALPYSNTRYHYGSRLEFDKKGFLYISVGDRGDQDANPQRLGSDCGKIHRIHADGHIPEDNPFVTQKGVRATLFSYGHRNPQGIALNPLTGELWETEHGPQGGDELNVIRAGKNYGWPVVSYGTHYDGRPFTQLTEKEGIENPKTYWIPSIAPCGLLFVNSDRYPAWKGDLLAGSLRFKYIERIRLDGEKVALREPLLKNLGRIRCIAASPDGYLYVAVEEPGYIFRLMPK